MLPGVQDAGEGNSGFYVRGGGPDQNLVLLDEGVVYNASHLFGFFSVFNPDAVKNITLTKGGMPAQYGGRLASVLDISMKDGNMKEDVYKRQAESIDFNGNTGPFIQYTYARIKSVLRKGENYPELKDFLSSSPGNYPAMNEKEKVLIKWIL